MVINFFFNLFFNIYLTIYLKDQKRMHRVVFTGGPCAGKTTAINRIKNFFENIGWKVRI